MEFISDTLAHYCEEHSSKEPDVLAQLNRHTHSHVLSPRMLSGHLQGRALAMFSHMIQPKYILEIGTYTGYSALCLAEGLIEGGKLITIDINEELENLVNKYIKDAAVVDKIEQVIGDALTIIPTLNYAWDLVFIDADKLNYINYYQLVIDQVKPGGYIIADNVLWSGKVIDENSLLKDKDTQAIHAFNEYIHHDGRVENVLLPIRDGLMVMRKY
jgi:predicted O-methyltransferase YrrM